MRLIINDLSPTPHGYAVLAGIAASLLSLSAKFIRGQHPGWRYYIGLTLGAFIIGAGAFYWLWPSVISGSIAVWRAMALSTASGLGTEIILLHGGLLPVRKLFALPIPGLSNESDKVNPK